MNKKTAHLIALSLVAITALSIVVLGISAPGQEDFSLIGKWQTDEDDYSFMSIVFTEDGYVLTTSSDEETVTEKGSYKQGEDSIIFHPEEGEAYEVEYSFDDEDSLTLYFEDEAFDLYRVTE